MKKKGILNYPIITLMIISPVLGEMISGSSPPSEYFQPIPILLFTMLYGIGAVIIREISRRWKKGWVSILLMGMAYGIFEEGIMVRSFFDPGWQDLGELAVYGRWIEVNWIWSIALTIFHAVVSISIPIAITELIFSNKKDILWLSNKEVIIFGIIFLINAPLGTFFGMKITTAGMLASVLSIIGLVFLAYKWPIFPEADRFVKAAPQWKIIFVGSLLMLGLIAGMWIFPSLSIPWMIAFVFLGGLPWIGIQWFRQLGANQWAEKQQWAGVIGLLIPWLLIDVLLELDTANHLDDTNGMILVALLFSAFLLILRILIFRRKEKTELL
ncbi:MAG: hypothetical protein J7K66_02075 [Anaerolineaceae bacterium]|nr:hypothetical protein [Anaerolineaceae bacterium]